jgi:cystathionine gamma-synthase
MGNFEAWLLLRSLRTLHLRVPRQSATATALAKWLAAAAGADKEVDGIPAGVIDKVWHSSLQGKDKRGFDPAKQMEGGWNATFSMQASFAWVVVSSHN